VEEVMQKPNISDRKDALIARRLETALRVTREDESRFKRIIEMRRLKRLAKKRVGSK
jgi:hypothetical protein